MQTVTLTFFKLSGFVNKFWGFRQMGLGYRKFASAKGLRFFKLLGAGAGNGFRWYPNFSTYALLCVWDTEKQADAYFQANKFFNRYKANAKEVYTIYLHPIEAHGLWSGQNPFEKTVLHDPAKPLAVLTRATIRTSRLLAFWKRVSGVSHSLEKYPGQLFAQGVGEWPIVQQATFSIWQTPDHMKAYAYNDPLHKEVIKLTREMGWYKEELFARFTPFRETGTWGGAGILSSHAITF
jgi:hypothetical protein